MDGIGVIDWLNSPARLISLIFFRVVSFIVYFFMPIAQKNSPKNINDYIAHFPKDVQKLLVSVRHVIKKSAPLATETMKYGIPTFVLDGNLVHFGGYAKHIGFYPTPSGIKAFQREIANYKSTKGAVQFPLGKPMPLGLIRKIVKFRVKENMALNKKSKKS